jgi:hypothetical protein
VVKGSIVLATEDQLSEEVGLKLAADAGLNVVQKLRRAGNGYLKKRMRNFCEIARQVPVVVLADLDRQSCPVTMMRSWLRGQHPTPDLIFRVAVAEVESWVLADHRAIASLFKLHLGVIPREPDALPDPKATLIQLAGRAPRIVREDLVPRGNSISSQGLGYNNRLSDLVNTSWDPDRAAARSPSLRRAQEALRKLALRLL